MGLLGKKWSNIVAIVLALCVVGLAVKYYNDAAGFAGYGLYVMFAGGALAIAGGVMGMRTKPTA
jgi:hypothetical protein